MKRSTSKFQALIVFICEHELELEKGGFYFIFYFISKKRKYIENKSMRIEYFGLTFIYLFLVNNIIDMMMMMTSTTTKTVKMRLKTS